MSKALGLISGRVAFNLSDLKSQNFTRFLYPPEILVSNACIQQCSLDPVTEMAGKEGNTPFEVRLLKNFL